MIDSSLPRTKQDWASFHDAMHRILEWHRPFFLGDTAQTLDPDFQLMLEAEANYGASAAMFGGKIFTREALDTDPSWASVEILKKRYEKSYVTTCRRYVQFSHNIPMLLVVSTPWWLMKPEDQEYRWRHFIPSNKFFNEFINITPDDILTEIDLNTSQKRGGPVGDFGMCLLDNNGNLHEFHAESFFNQHYILTLIAYYKTLKTRIAIITKS